MAIFDPFAPACGNVSTRPRVTQHVDPAILRASLGGRADDARDRVGDAMRNVERDARRSAERTVLRSLSPRTTRWG